MRKNIRIIFSNIVKILNHEFLEPYGLLLNIYQEMLKKVPTYGNFFLIKMPFSHAIIYAFTQSQKAWAILACSKK